MVAKKYSYAWFKQRQETVNQQISSWPEWMKKASVIASAYFPYRK